MIGFLPIGCLPVHNTLDGPSFGAESYSSGAHDLRLVFRPGTISDLSEMTTAFRVLWSMLRKIGECMCNFVYLIIWKVKQEFA